MFVGLTVLSMIFGQGQQGGITRTETNKPVRFEDYPAEVFNGVPAQPKIVNPVHRKYRTRIRTGVEKGWGVFHEGTERKGPNFAGHIIAVQWGCGTGCRAMVFVDAHTGEIYDPPLSIGRLFDQRIGLPMFEGGSAHT
jgi:hypothetical protein